MLLPILLGQGIPATLLDVAEILNNLVPVLHAKSLAELNGNSELLTTETELYEHVDEAAQRLARRAALFVTYDNTLTITGGSSTLATPSRHLSTIHAAFDSDEPNGAFRPLAPASVAELEALDPDWPSAAGTPSHFTHDQEGTETVRAYKTPAADTSLALVYHEHLATIASGSSAVNVPLPVGDYFHYAALAAVHGQEHDEVMPEIEAYARQRSELYEDVFRTYWGEPQ